ncbi:MAG TPA: ABC transporter substrate-binding protein [Methylomirabilota bacterium]|jgi:NitT/TauT family transport system substrate-binding protein|nr:ABC transporter substrate-binding protein [Methylomirabilota bacterium]
MPRSRSRAALVLASAVLLLSAAGTTALAQPRHKLTQAGFRVLYMAPAFIALEKGFFAQEGVDFTFTELDSGALGAAAVISGNAQISDLDPLGVARLQQEGKPLVLFYNLVGRVTLDLILRAPVAQRLGLTGDTPLAARYAALKGLTIGITRPGAPTDVFARYFLVRAGLNPDRDATLVQVGGVPALAAAFKSERIDAFLLSPPLPQTLEREGVGRIVIRNTAGEVPELRDTTYAAMFTTGDYARRNGAALQAYGRALRLATAWLQTNKPEALRILGEKYFRDTPPESLAISLDATLPAISTDGRFSQTGVQRYLDIFKTVGETVSASAAEGVLWTNEFVR